MLLYKVAEEYKYGDSCDKHGYYTVFKTFNR